MKLLFLTNLYPPFESGGYGSLCRDVAEGLRHRGHDVRILTSTHGLGSRPLPPESHVDRRLELDSDLVHYRPADFFLRRPGRLVRNLAVLQETIAAFQPEAVMVWGMWQLSHWLPYWAERWLPDRVSYYIGSYWPADQDTHRGYWGIPGQSWFKERIKKLPRAFVRRRLDREGYPPRLAMAHVACCSRYVREALISQGKIGENAVVIYGGIDLAAFPFNPTTGSNGSLRLLYFGRLVADKGVHTAIEALAHLRRQGVASHHLTILGSGHPRYEKRLRELVAANDLDTSVTFAGRIDRENVPAFIKKFDIFLFTSIWPEPFGLTLIEAMAAGQVLIAADVGGSREILIDYDHELLFPPGNAAALAERIQLLAGSPEKMARLAAKGRRQVIERYALSATVDEIESYLGRLVNQGAPLRKGDR